MRYFILLTIDGSVHRVNANAIHEYYATPEGTTCIDMCDSSLRYAQETPAQIDRMMEVAFDLRLAREPRKWQPTETADLAPWQS
jgi:hypothetical protein